MKKSKGKCLIFWHFLARKNESDFPKIVKYCRKIKGTTKPHWPAIYVKFSKWIWLDLNFNTILCGLFWWDYLQKQIW